jgi:creatinine amidohydrolase
MLASYLSTTEIKKCLQLTVLLPLGAFEQHGPHLPLMTDSLIAEEIARKVENANPKKVLLFPTIWFGTSNEHQGFPGTLSLTAVHLINLLGDLFTWLEASGFKKGILLNAHGGNVGVSTAACEEFSRDHQFKIRPHFIYTAKVNQLSQTLFHSHGSHAGSSESSLLHALRPDLEIKKSVFSNPHPYNRGKDTFALYQTQELSPSGILDPNPTVTIDPKKGQKLATIITQEIEARLKFF